jgi:Zn-dependent metalloprotease
MKNKSADFVLDVLIALTRNKVLHWEYCIDVLQQTEPDKVLDIAHMQGIASAYRNTLRMLEREKEW